MWRFFLKKQSKLINNVLILKNNNNNNKCIIKYVKHCKNDNNIHFQRQITRTLSTTMPTTSDYDDNGDKNNIVSKERYDYYTVSEKAITQMTQQEKYLSHTLHAKTTLETRNRVDIADAKRLSFRLSTELPRHFLLYFNKGIEANMFPTDSTSDTDKNVRKFLRGLDRQANILDCMPIFSELALFLGINTFDTPFLNKWRSEQAHISSMNVDHLLEFNDLPQLKGGFETPVGSDEMIDFFEDIFAIFRGPDYTKELHSLRKNYIMDVLYAIGAKELIFAAKGKGLHYSPITNEEKLVALYPISAFLVNLKWFYGAPVNLKQIKDIIDPDQLEKCAGMSLYDVFIMSLVEEYSNAKINENNKNDIKYIKYLSEKMVEADEFGVVRHNIVDMDDFEIVKKQDRVIRILHLFSKLFLNRNKDIINNEEANSDNNNNDNNNNIQDNNNTSTHNNYAIDESEVDEQFTLNDVILSNKFTFGTDNSGDMSNDNEIDVLLDILITASTSSTTYKNGSSEMEYHFSGLFSALLDNYNPSLFAQHLGRLHGISPKSICAETKAKKSKKYIWGNILPIRCNDYHFDETLLLLRNYFALRGGNEYKLKDKELRDIIDTLENQWKIEKGIVDELDIDDAEGISPSADENIEAPVHTRKMDERLYEHIEIECTDQIVSLLTKDEVKGLIQNIKSYKIALNNVDTKIATKKKILRSIFNLCGRNANLIWPNLIRLVPFINTNRLYLKKVSHDKYASKTLSLNLTPAFDNVSWDTSSFNKAPGTTKRVKLKKNEDENADIFGDEVKNLHMNLNEEYDWIDEADNIRSHDEMEEEELDTSKYEGRYLFDPAIEEKTVVIRDLPPLITEEEIIDGLCHIGNISKVTLYNGDFFGGDKENCHTNAKFNALLFKRLDLKSVNLSQSPKVKMMKNNLARETPIFAFVEFESMEDKVKAMTPALKVFGCNVGSSVNIKGLPSSYFIEGRGSKAGSGNPKNKQLRPDIIKIENSCLINDVKDYRVLELESTYYSAKRDEYIEEINNKLSELFSIDDPYHNINNSSNSINENLYNDIEDEDTSLNDENGMENIDDEDFLNTLSTFNQYENTDYSIGDTNNNRGIDIGNAIVKDRKCYLHFPTYTMALKAYERLSYLNELNDGMFQQPMRINWYLKKKFIVDNDGNNNYGNFSKKRHSSFYDNNNNEYEEDDEDDDEHEFLKRLSNLL